MFSLVLSAADFAGDLEQLPVHNFQRSCWLRILLEIWSNCLFISVSIVLDDAGFAGDLEQLPVHNFQHSFLLRVLLEI